MRLRNLILCLLLCIASASAKDIITKTDGTKLDVKVEEITGTSIKYRKASNLNGPIYTIPVTSVAVILYENGMTDTFNELLTVPKESNNQSATPSDEELMRLAETQSYSTTKGYLSDYELLKIASGWDKSYEDLLKQAKKYRKIGWIGAGTILAVGTIGTTVIFGVMWGFEDDDIVDLVLPIAGVCSLGAAAVWTLGYNLKANSLMKQARQIQSYSYTIIENDIMQIGKNYLTAGINLMGNRVVNSHSIGLSLGINF